MGRISAFRPALIVASVVFHGRPSRLASKISSLSARSGCLRHTRSKVCRVSVISSSRPTVTPERVTPTLPGQLAVRRELMSSTRTPCDTDANFRDAPHSPPVSRPGGSPFFGCPPRRFAWCCRRTRDTAGSRRLPIPPKQFAVNPGRPGPLPPTSKTTSGVLNHMCSTTYRCRP